MLNFVIVILIYWIILIIKYDYDRKIPIAYDENLLEKINPIVAGSIINNKDVCFTDIIAIILNLVRKKVLKLISEKNLIGGYNNTIELNSDIKDIMIDDIEKIVLETVLDGQRSVELESRLLFISKTYVGKHYMKKIKRKLNEKLDELGANNIIAPKHILFVNNIVFILSMVWIVWSIGSRIDLSFLEKLNNVELIKMGVTAIIIVLTMIPIVLYSLAILLKVQIYIKMKINRLVSVITNKRLLMLIITNTIISTIFFMILTYVFKMNLFTQFLLYTIVLNIILTDHVMAKHSRKVLKIYYQLEMIKQKIVNYSLLKEKNIVDYHLWETYLIYSIAFMLNKDMIYNILGKSSDETYSTFINNIYTNEELTMPQDMIVIAKEYQEVLDNIQIKK